MDLILQSAFGFVAILFLAWLASENRSVVAWRTVIAGILLQIVFAAALGLKSIVAGTLATCMTGAVFGMLWIDSL